MHVTRHDGFVVSTDPAALDRNTIHGFLRDAYWSPNVPRETFERSVEHSLPEMMQLTTGRVVEPQEIADAVVWLASPRSGSASGTEVVVDGGFLKVI